MTGALDGLRVVEIAGDIAGPYCTKLLADLGAEVTKIEPSSGDPLRSWGPFPGDVNDPNRCGMFEYLNAGKRGRQSISMLTSRYCVLSSVRPTCLSMDCRPRRSTGSGSMCLRCKRCGPALLSFVSLRSVSTDRFATGR